MGIQVRASRALALCRRNAIMKMEAAIRNLPEQGERVGNQVMVQVPSEHFPIQHHWAPGAYGREMLIRKGSVVVGKIHRHAHINVISAGVVRVFTEGEGEQLLAAPYTFVSSPGTKRVVEALEDTVWTTMHVTNSTDLSEIEKELIATDYQENTE